jgi:hypothetical protein
MPKTPQPFIGEQFEVAGKSYMVVGDGRADGQPGLWWVCDVNDPNAKPILRDEKFIAAGRSAASPS